MNGSPSDVTRASGHECRAPGFVADRARNSGARGRAAANGAATTERGTAGRLAGTPGPHRPRDPRRRLGPAPQLPGLARPTLADPDAVDDLTLAVYEALANVVDHAYVERRRPGVMRLWAAVSPAAGRRPRPRRHRHRRGRVAPRNGPGWRGRGLPLMHTLAHRGALRRHGHDGAAAPPGRARARLRTSGLGRQERLVPDTERLKTVVTIPAPRRSAHAWTCPGTPTSSGQAGQACGAPGPSSPARRPPTAGRPPRRPPGRRADPGAP